MCVWIVHERPNIYNGSAQCFKITLEKFLQLLDWTLIDFNKQSSWLWINTILVLTSAGTVNSGCFEAELEETLLVLMDGRHPHLSHCKASDSLTDLHIIRRQRIEMSVEVWMCMTHLLWVHLSKLDLYLQRALGKSRIQGCKDPHACYLCLFAPHWREGRGQQNSLAFKGTCTETSCCEQSCFWQGKRLFYTTIEKC